MRRLAIVGSGARATFSFVRPLLHELPDEVALVGLYDPNPKRMAACNALAGTDLPCFASFEQMLDEARPDGIIVTSVDATHAEYVVAALNRGIDAYSEKPLCTTAAQVAAIRQAAATSSAASWVTHNMRFVPDVVTMMRVISEGGSGRVLSIAFTETLDRSHGANYFRRWHRNMANSAGLMVHKSSHHFDVMNWLADAPPERVTALGKLAFYGANGPFHGERCSTCEHSAECPLYTDIMSDQRLKTLYVEPESEDGYYRDACLYHPSIDIPDTVSASIGYANGVVANYSLIAYASYESVRIAIEGTHGRLELYERKRIGWADAEVTVEDAWGGWGTSLTELHHYDIAAGQIHDLTAATVAGGHGGADPRMRHALFARDPAPDPLGQKASLEEGIQAILVGLAANASIAAHGQPIDVQSLAAR